MANKEQGQELELTRPGSGTQNTTTKVASATKTPDSASRTWSDEPIRSKSPQRPWDGFLERVMSQGVPGQGSSVLPPGKSKSPAKVPEPWDGLLTPPQISAPRSNCAQVHRMPGNYALVHAFTPIESAQWAGKDESNLPSLFFDLWREGMNFGEYGGASDNMMIESSGIQLILMLGSEQRRTRLVIKSLVDSRETIFISLANEMLVSWDRGISPERVRQWLVDRAAEREAGLTGVLDVLEKAGVKVELAELLAMNNDELGNISAACELLGPSAFVLLVNIGSLKDIASLQRTVLLSAIRPGRVDFLEALGATRVKVDLTILLPLENGEFNNLIAAEQVLGLPKFVKLLRYSDPKEIASMTEQQLEAVALEIDSMD